MKVQSQIMSYSTLETTRTCLASAGAVQLALSISQILAGTPLEKPLLHNAPQQIWTNQYVVYLTTDEIESIREILFNAEAASVRSDGEATEQTSFYASLVDVWSDLFDQAKQ
ncbi:hypothetical protein [Hymenobacter sp. UYP22]|uniref:hypothetical protein n=1 Tax=Hymenobacter sp. UYP22 TaxID=3156348 RepID=UPI00339782FA